MEDRNRIVVTEYVPAETVSLDPNHKSKSIVSPAMVGVIGTILLHLLLAESLGVTLGAGERKLVQSQVASIGAHLNNEAPLVLLGPIARPASKEVLLDVILPMQTAAIDNLASLKPPVIEFERLSVDDQVEAAAGLTDPALAKADEIYKNQIMARIERIWRRPTSSKDSAESSFQCRAQLEQDEHGNVREVLLPACDASIAWRESLLAAIRQASPLPAPPDIRVYRASLVLHFVGAVVPGEFAERH